jgi:phenylalanyl-tRNA synthetase beta chain
MYELGNPIHAFDYDKISGHLMQVDTAKAGEAFKSVDGISYKLPKNAVIIRDQEKIIDLCGIKGGYASGTFPNTKTIVLRVPVEVPILIRRTSQALALRSDASSIFERGVNAGGTIDALVRCASLILDIAGGEIASKLYDIRTENFAPWKLSLRISRLNKILGVDLPQKRVLEILDSLNLSPKQGGNDTIACLIPTYRNDLKIEEDLIEEIARIYGLNNFPKTLPIGQIPTIQIPYYKDYRIDEKVKNLLQAAGFSEIYTYSLISGDDLSEININSAEVLKVDTPVSREYEYLRPTLKINLQKALRKNKANFDKLSLFELGKVYLGGIVTDAKEEYRLSGITNSKTFFEVKGILERLYKDLNISSGPAEFIEVLEDGIFFELNYDHLLKQAITKKTYTPISNFPPIVEDLAIIAPKNISTGSIMDTIKKQNPLITNVSLLDKFDNTRTFHIIYQSYEKNLTDKEIEPIRSKILKVLNEKYSAKLKI